MSSTPGRPSMREDVLEAGVHLVRRGQAVSMDSVAAEAGMTKPGLMYHFPTKRSLMLGLVDHVIDAYELDLTSRLAHLTSSPTPRDRHEVYLRWAVESTHDAVDLVMLSDPRLRGPLLERWAERLHPWIAVPQDLPAAERARLHAVRMMADGCWFADSAQFWPLSRDERDELLSVGLSLLERR